MADIGVVQCPTCGFPYNPKQGCARCIALKEKKEELACLDKLSGIFPSDQCLIISPKAIHQNAVDHGWTDRERPVPELIALIHSEASEALEGYRNSVKPGEKGWVGEELADIVIRVFDAAEELGIDIIQEVAKKHEYNKSRPYRHGGKKI